MVFTVAALSREKRRFGTGIMEEINSGSLSGKKVRDPK